MRHLATTILLFLSLTSKGQTTLGIGLVSINFNDKTVLHFYNDPTDKEPVKTIEFFNDSNNWNIRNLNKQIEWLRPEVLWLDYSSFVFRCKSKSENWYQVIVNNDTGKSLWIKKDSFIVFSGWENFLKGMFGIARLRDTKQKIRKSPNDTAQEINYDCKYDCFQVKSMKGDWIEIFSTDDCDDGTDTKCGIIKSGWIRWRKGNKLLIEYFVTS